MPLQIEFMNASRSPYTKSGRALSPSKSDPWLFWWTVAIFVLLALATFSWFFSLYVFRHPEIPKNYRLLSKLNKLEPIARFNERTVPQAKFHSAKEIYTRFFNYTDREIDAQNGLLKRHYIQNYSDAQPVYIKGDYRIYQVGELTAKNAITSGLVVRAKARDFPNVSIEFVFPTSDPPSARPAIGDDLVLKTNDNFASVLHISRLPEESLCFTVVPLTYYSYPVGEEQWLALSPPPLLNMDAQWPLTHDAPPADSVADRVVAGRGQ
jgi:hypothetical protein